MALTYVFLPTKGNAEKLVGVAIAVGAGVVVFAVAKWGKPFARWFAALWVKAAVFGLYAWGESRRGKHDDDALWDWFTDQLLVVQHRYAFVVGCIAFRPDQPTRCLMVRRAFRGFGDDRVILWPGGRLRGSIDDFETEVRQLVSNETGCNVKLLAVSRGANADFGKRVYTFDPHSRRSNLANALLEPPIIMMQQNRRQSHDVPGHIDLIFLGSVEDGSTVRDPGMWLDLADFGSHTEGELWPDTRECLKAAGEIYRKLMTPQTGTP